MNKLTKEHKMRISMALKGRVSPMLNRFRSLDTKAIHVWVRNHKSPIRCLDCGISRRDKLIQWSNVNHKYKRRLEDFQPRCAKCHHDFDVKHNNYINRGIFHKGIDKRRIKTQFKKGHAFFGRK